MGNKCIFVSLVPNRIFEDPRIRISLLLLVDANSRFGSEEVKEKINVCQFQKLILDSVKRRKQGKKKKMFVEVHEKALHVIK